MKKYIVIAGASSGIGLELTKKFLDDNAKVFACSRSKKNLKKNKNLIVFDKCDVSKEKDIKRFVRKVKQKTKKIDILINCAGFFGPIGPFYKNKSEDWIYTIKTMVFGTFLMSKHLVPLLKKSIKPTIINFSGGGAFNPFPNYSAYATSKSAVVRLTENMATELKKYKIVVNAIAPGFVLTDIHKKTLKAGPKKSGKKHYEETKKKIIRDSVPISKVIDCIKFLISDSGRKISGKTISASFDPWDKEIFAKKHLEINKSSLYTMQRINLIHLKKEIFEK